MKTMKEHISALQSTEQKLLPGGQGYPQHSGGSADSNTDRSNTGNFYLHYENLSMQYTETFSAV